MVTSNLDGHDGSISTLKMEAADFSEMLVNTNERTWYQGHNCNKIKKKS
jgi:hypothetical protein